MTTRLLPVIVLIGLTMLCVQLQNDTSQAGTTGSGSGSWSYRCPSFPVCTLDATFEAVVGPNELFKGTYVVTGGELGCLGPNLQNVATGVGGISAFSQQSGTSGSVITDPITRKTTITQSLFISAAEWAGVCSQPGVYGPGGTKPHPDFHFCTENNYPLSGPDDNFDYPGTAPFPGRDVFAAFWNVGPGTGTTCNNNWYEFVAFPNDWSLTGQILTKCQKDANGNIIPDTCTEKTPKTFHCTSNKKLRNLLDNVSDSVTVVYTCVR